MIRAALWFMALFGVAVASALVDMGELEAAGRHLADLRKAERAEGGRSERYVPSEGALVEEGNVDSLAE